MFPLKNYTHPLPTGKDLGAYGVAHKHDVHTGIDLYCNEGDEVFAMKSGKIVAIDWFTGPKVNMPWWNDTQAIAIKSNGSVIVYGEIIPNEKLKVGDIIYEGDLLGRVTPVLKEKKGRVPSLSMLHIETYYNYLGKWETWELGLKSPSNLFSPHFTLINSDIDVNNKTTLFDYLRNHQYIIPHEDGELGGLYYPNTRYPWLNYDYKDFYISMSFGIQGVKDIKIKDLTSFNHLIQIINIPSHSGVTDPW